MPSSATRRVPCRPRSTRASPRAWATPTWSRRARCWHGSRKHMGHEPHANRPPDRRGRSPRRARPRRRRGRGRGSYRRRGGTRRAGSRVPRSARVSVPSIVCTVWPSWARRTSVHSRRSGDRQRSSMTKVAPSFSPRQAMVSVAGSKRPLGRVPVAVGVEHPLAERARGGVHGHELQVGVARRDARRPELDKAAVERTSGTRHPAGVGEHLALAVAHCRLGPPGAEEAVEHLLGGVVRDPPGLGRPRTRRDEDCEQQGKERGPAHPHASCPALGPGGGACFGISGFPSRTEPR